MPLGLSARLQITLDVPPTFAKAWVTKERRPCASASSTTRQEHPAGSAQRRQLEGSGHQARPAMRAPFENRRRNSMPFRAEPGSTAVVRYESHSFGFFLDSCGWLGVLRLNPAFSGSTQKAGIVANERLRLGVLGVRWHCASFAYVLSSSSRATSASAIRDAASPGC